MILGSNKPFYCGYQIILYISSFDHIILSDVYVTDCTAFFVGNYTFSQFRRGFVDDKFEYTGRWPSPVRTKLAQ